MLAVMHSILIPSRLFFPLDQRRLLRCRDYVSVHVLACYIGFAWPPSPPPRQPDQGTWEENQPGLISPIRGSLKANK